MSFNISPRSIWIALGWLLALSVIYLSLSPLPPNSGFDHGDKFGHLSAYATLMAWWHQIDRNAYRLALIFVVMGLILEILQHLSGFRQGDIFDMAANTLGVGIGWLLGRSALRWSVGKLTP
jgi:VanZ family protein